MVDEGLYFSNWFIDCKEVANRCSTVSVQEQAICNFWSARYIIAIVGIFVLIFYFYNKNKYKNLK